MSKTCTLEQCLLTDAEKILLSFQYDQRLTVLEACASLVGGFEIEEYWQTFGIKVSQPNTIKKIARDLYVRLTSIDIPISLALSSLSREPLSIFVQKETGAFYTDFRLAKFVAENCRNYIQPNSTVADISAGSGILLAAVSELYREKFSNNYDQWISNSVFAFDLSKIALRGARIALSAHTSNIKALKKMSDNWLVCDSLLADEKIFQSYDIVVGNPPWGKIKLSRHAFVNKTKAEHHIYGAKYQDFDKKKFLSEKQDFLDYSKYLKERYHLLNNVEPDMYIAFLEKAINILKPGGHLSYIVPAGLIRSLGTKPLRSYLINSSSYLKYYLLDNKPNFFQIDTRFKFVIVAQEKSLSRDITCKDIAFEICKGTTQSVIKTEEIKFNVSELANIRPDLTIPECRNNIEKSLFAKICQNGRPWKDEWKVDIAREVDMTNDRFLFHKKQSESDIPVIEGRMVQQFRFGAKAYVSGSGRSAKWIPNAGKLKAQFFISKENIKAHLLHRINTLRIGYCDIAGQTNERAMMSAIIPPGVVCGNKVPTLVFPNDENHEMLYLFIGITNSFVFDWIMRRIISTTVNYFLLFSVPMPNIDFSSVLAKKIITLSKELSDMDGNFYTEKRMEQIRAEIDIAVATAYGLNFSDLKTIMQDFPLLDRQQPVIKGEIRSTFTRDLLLSTAEKNYKQKDLFYTQRMSAGLKLRSRAYIPTEMTSLCTEGVYD